MRNTDYFKNKKVAIVGLARSGLACANLLYGLDAQVNVTDSQDSELTRLNASQLKSEKINVELGKHSPEFIMDRELVVISPGVTDAASPVVWAKQYGIPVVSEIEVACILCPATIIAITGTNGKTTVTTLVGRILETSGKRAFICGNIGNPFCQDLDKMETQDYVSLEISSFQLEKIRTFKPKIAAILNFTCDHLDRYKDMQEYLQAKKRIFMNQDESDFLILNYDDALVRQLAKDAKANVVYFRQTPGLNPNYCAVLSVASALGIDKELCLDVFSKFKGVEHRLEHVAELQDIEFINDSKATNVDSTAWALENITRPIVLIAGGRDKGSDYSVILDLARKKVKSVVLIGEAKGKIKDAFSKSLPVEEAPNLQQAVGIAFYKARPGDCVLLSPMCSSFDMFSNYEERGRFFKKAVHDLIKSKS